MRHDPNTHHRRSIRLQGYDYAQEGAYFVTICTHHRTCLFGEVVDSAMQLSGFGEIVQDCWFDIPAHFPYVELDAFVVMPNHVHGVIVIVDEEGRGKVCTAPTSGFGRSVAGSLSAIVGSFKSAVTKQINEIRKTPRMTIWQRGYYDHVIRDEEDLNRIRQYIVDNPAHWELDSENPVCAREKT
ncbi:MAG: transposase [Anaerolineae bacterium]|nr:transposase [Anaerolineae bacterium]